MNHDIEPLPNGNVLMLAWEKKSPKEACDAGRNHERIGEEGLWPDCIIEVEREGENGGKIVWEWHAWDHLIQEIDRKLDNYGKVAEHPERININSVDWESGLTKDEEAKLRALGYLAGPGAATPALTRSFLPSMKKGSTTAPKMPPSARKNRGSVAKDKIRGR